MSGVVFLLPGTSLEDVAAAVRDAVAVELARLDVPVSTRATPADVTTTVGAPIVPTVEVGP